MSHCVSAALRVVLHLALIRTWLTMAVASQDQVMIMDSADVAEEALDVKEACNELVHQFACAPGLCIPVDWRCNGRSDCPDGGDENNCGKTLQIHSAVRRPYVLVLWQALSSHLHSFLSLPVSTGLQLTFWP